MFGLDLTTAQKVLVAAAVILVLLALLGLFVRQIQGGRLRLRGQGSGRTRQPRLGVVDIHDLDRQRQLVLIRRDNVEHLLMVGGASDVVIETNIVRGGGRAHTPAQAELPLADRPQPFETLLPSAEPARLEPVPEFRRAQAAAQAAASAPEPTPIPQRQVPPVQMEPSAPLVAAGAGLAAAVAAAVRQQPEPETVPAPAPKPEAPSFAREHAPPPPVSAGELDDMARQLEEALKRPFSAVRPSRMAEAPEPVAPVVELPPAPQPEPEPEPAPAPVVALPEPIPAAPEPAPAPAAVHHQPHVSRDVEAELAMALGLTPDHVVAREVPPPPPRFAPAPPVVVPPPVVEAPAPAIEHPAPEPVPEPAPQPEPEPVHAPVAVAAPEEKPAEAVLEVREAVVTETVVQEEKPEPAQIDPFSVDAIEAEFARLLGRDPKAKS